MTVSDDKKSLICPYCGSIEALDESDEVKIQRIKTDAQTKVELKKLEHELEKEKIQEESKHEKSFKKSIWSKLLVVFTAISLIVAVVYLSDGISLVGIIALGQAVIYTAAWLIGMDIIRTKLKNLSLLLTIIGLLLIIPFVKACSDHNDIADAEHFSWTAIAIGDKLPSPDEPFGEIITNDDERLYIKLVQESYDNYVKYQQSCIDFGYTIEADQGTNSYEAYSPDGYKLSLSYSESGESITVILDAPIELTEISWPSSGVGSLLPPPESTIGYISQESSDSFSVLIGNMTREQMLDYAKVCEAVGFDVDYSYTDNSYSAQNSDGVELHISYEGFNQASIRVYLPNEDDTVSEEETTVFETTLAPETTRIVETTEKPDTEEPTTVAETTQPAPANDEIRPEIKEFLDSYEAFYDGYIEFMQTYSSRTLRPPCLMNILT